MNRLMSALFLKKCGMAAILVFLTAALPVFALEENPCTDEFKQFCPEVTPGGGRLIRCYEERREKFSTACRAYIDQAKSYAEVLKKACAKEIEKACNFEKGDPLEMLDCLQSNYVDLSPDCRKKLTDFKRVYPKPVQ